MKIKIDWKKAAQITLSFVKPLVKPFIAALVGGGVVSGLSGCSSLKPSDKTQTMGVYAFGIPGIAVITQSTQTADNAGDDANVPVQTVPVSVTEQWSSSPGGAATTPLPVAARDPLG